MAFLVINTQPINWRILKGSPTKRKLLSLKGYTFLNPYNYSQAYKSSDLLFDFNKHVGREYILTTKGIILSVDDAENPDYGRLFEYLKSLFAYLRYESMQTQIKAGNAVQLIFTKPAISEGKVDFHSIDTISVSAHWYNTMISWRCVAEADKKISNQVDFPVYEDVLLDSFEALTENHYRKAILFAAVAVESMLANTFDKIYAKALKTNDKKRTHRFIKNGDSSISDPIYKSLKDRTDFKRLLHEIPLYLENRSILQDNGKLYHSLIKLYASRNKIVHWGAPIEEDKAKLIPITQEGAKLAFEAALDTFLWAGISRYEILRESKFIMIKG